MPLEIDTECFRKKLVFVRQIFVSSVWFKNVYPYKIKDETLAQLHDTASFLENLKQFTDMNKNMIYFYSQLQNILIFLRYG